MPRIILLASPKLIVMVLLLVLLAACLLVPIECDPSRDPELDKPLHEDHRNREMDPATAKTIVPPAGPYVIKPSEVWKQ